MSGYIEAVPDLPGVADFAAAGAAGTIYDARFGGPQNMGPSNDALTQLATEIMDARWYSDSLPEVIAGSIQVFGNVPTDGVTDAYPLIEAQWAAFCAAGGGTIAFPPIANPIYLGTPLTWPTTNVPIRLLLNGNALYGAPSSYAIDTSTGVVGSTAAPSSIESGRIVPPTTGTRAQTRTSSGIRVRNCNNFRFLDLYCSNLNKAFDVINDGAGMYNEQHLFDHCFAVGNKYGVSLTAINSGPPSFDESWFIHCGFSGNYTYDVYQASGTNMFRGGFRDCTTWLGSNNTTGISVYIDGNMAQGTYEFGMECTASVTSPAIGFYVGPDATNQPGIPFPSSNLGVVRLRALNDDPAAFTHIAAVDSGNANQYLSYSDGFTTWGTSVSGGSILFSTRKEGDTYPRVQIHADGTTYFGDGSGAPTAGFYGNTSGGGGSGLTATAPIIGANGVSIMAGTTTPPTDSLFTRVAAGMLYFDETNNKLWVRNASGTWKGVTVS